MQKYIKIHPDDKVAVALCHLDAGLKVFDCGTEITLSEDIPQGHKFALQDIDKEESVVKYGNAVGIAISLIRAGEWVHTHNMRTSLGDTLRYTYDKKDAAVNSDKTRFFQGYRRKDGRVGVRNEIWIVPTVGCVNSVAAEVERRSCSMRKGGVEAICAFAHPYGCSQMGEDQEYTRQILADLINHPNAGGVLVLGLGCENSNIDELKKYIGSYDEKRVKFLNAQTVEDEIETALSLIRELIDHIAGMKREPIPLSELIIG